MGSRAPGHAAEGRRFRRYDTSRLNDLPRVQPPWLRGMRPLVLQLEQLRPLELPIGSMQGPRPAGRGHRAARYEPRGYNPSIALAPVGLCALCRYVAAVRIAATHQCDEAGATTNGFRGTALAVLDPELHLVAWAWWYNGAERQLHGGGAASQGLSWRPAAEPSERNHSSWPLPWPEALYDVRLLLYEGRLLATHQCRACKTFSVYLVNLRGQTNRAGGLDWLRAWSRPKNTLTWSSALHPGWALLAGANQALFEYSASQGGRASLMAQPWLHVVVGLRWRNGQGLPIRFATKPQPDPYELGTESVADVLVERRHSFFGPKLWFGNDSQLGNAFRMMDGTCHETLARRSTSQPTVDANRGPTLPSLCPGVSPPSSVATAAFQFRPLLSTTCNLIRVARTISGRVCEALLGVGHLHRGRSSDGKRWRRASLGKGSRPREVFRWGHGYSHFFYTLQPFPPFRMLATSREICLASAQDPTSCESIQMVFGIVNGPNDSLVLSFGVNDCEARLGMLPLETVWSMLDPLGGDVASGGPCTFRK